MSKNTVQYDKAEAERRAKDAKRKREKRAKLKDAIDLVASEMAKPPKERVALHAQIASDGANKLGDAMSAMADAVDNIASAFGISPEKARAAHDAAKNVLDEPVPVRLSVIALAHTFSESCAALAEAERVFDQAVAARAKAKLALDAEIARMANEVG